MFDRDEVAVVNIARRGRLRFDRSEGEAEEAMMQEPDASPTRPKVILKVDASKFKIGMSRQLNGTRLDKPCPNVN